MRGKSLALYIDQDYTRLVDMMLGPGENKSEMMREALMLLAEKRGFVVEYQPATLTIKKID